ncbi:MAG: hypothetical protein ACRD2T_00370 [Thermoanaerobaculia bacterium]
MDLGDLPRWKPAEPPIAVQKARSSLRQCDQLLAGDPTDAAAHHGRAHALEILGEPARAAEDFNRAAAWFTRAIERMARSPGPYLARARFRACRKDYRGAIGDFEKAHSLDPESADVLNDFAWLLATAPREHRDPERAVALAERAVRNAAHPYPCLNTLGAALYRAGRFGEAAEMLERAGRAQPEGPTAFDHFFLALAHHQLGRSEPAADALDRALRWWKSQEYLHPELTAELEALRAEAEAALGVEAGR